MLFLNRKNGEACLEFVRWHGRIASEPPGTFLHKLLKDLGEVQSC